MQVVLDSSVIVAAFRKEEPHADAALFVIEQLDAGRFDALIAATVPVEVVAAIRRRTGKQRLARAVGHRVLAMPTVRVVDLNAFRMLGAIDLASLSGLRGMDVVIVHVAATFDAPLVTLDHELAERAAPYVDVITIENLAKQLS